MKEEIKAGLVELIEVAEDFHRTSAVPLSSYFGSYVLLVGKWLLIGLLRGFNGIKKKKGKQLERT